MKDLRIHATTSQRCNNACLFCMEFDARTGRRTGSDLPPEQAYLTLERLLAALRPEHRALPVLFTGGEPTLNVELPVMAQALRQRGFREIGLQTNGRRLSDPAFAARLVRAGISRFAISLHGSAASVHDSMTRAPGSWEQTRRGLAVLLALKRRWPWLHVSTTTTVAAPNLPDLGALLGRLLTLPGLDVVVLNPLCFEGNALMHFDALAVRYRDLSKAFARARRALERSGVRGLERVSWTDFPPCVGPETAAHAGSFERVILIETTSPTELLPPKLWFAGEKAPSCARCRYEKSCTGVSPRYVERFGWGEFRPIAERDL